MSGIIVIILVDNGVLRNFWKICAVSKSVAAQSANKNLKRPKGQFDNSATTHFSNFSFQVARLTFIFILLILLFYICLILADMLALVWSTEALFDLKIKKVSIEISSSRLPAIMSMTSIPWNLHHLSRRVLRALECFEEVHLALVHQGSNTIADCIAGSSLQQRHHQSYLARSGPCWLNSQIHRDTMGDLGSVSC